MTDKKTQEPVPSAPAAAVWRDDEVGPVERLLRRFVPHRELGWAAHGERLTRFVLLKTPWFSVFLHKLDAPHAPPFCHDHPFAFMAVILAGGYTEATPAGVFRRIPGDVLCHRAASRHNVVTAGVNWSLVIANRKTRRWRFIEEHDASCRPRPADTTRPE